MPSVEDSYNLVLKGYCFGCTYWTYDPNKPGNCEHANVCALAIRIAEVALKGRGEDEHER